jgi:VCBS repeat protein
MRTLATLFCLAACTESDPVEIETIHGPPISPEIRQGFLLETPAYYGVAPADYDGDGKADLSIKLDGGTWKIDYSTNGFGVWDREEKAGAGVPVPGRYDDDNEADLAVVDGNHWRIALAADDYGSWRDITLGLDTRALGRPVPADYDGDAILDLAVRNVQGEWLIDYSGDGYNGWEVVYDQFQDLVGDAAPADYDGDGRADLAVKDRDGAWHIDYSRNGFGTIDASYTGWGDATWHPVPADYNGDGYADLAVKWDAGVGVWMIDFARPGVLADEATRFEGYDVLYSNAGGTTARAVPADYDGDGKADLAVRVDCGSWFVDDSIGGLGAWDHAYDVGSHEVFTVPPTGGEAALQTTLDSDFTGTIFVPSYITLYLTWHRKLPVKSCVRIRGTRQGLSEGPLLQMDDADTSVKESYSLFSVTGHDVTIDGLRLRGPQVGNDSSQDEAVGVQVFANSTLGTGGNVLFDNNEASSWPGAALGVTGPLQPKLASLDEVPVGAPVMSPGDAGLIRATRNNFHDNSRDSYGYGVGVGQGAYVTIEGNVFTYNRHAVASSNEPHTGYVARFNYILEGGFTEDSAWNQHFDVHGSSDKGYGGMAGEQYEIASNTIRGEQNYYLVETRPAFMLRGTPTLGASFHHNVVVHDDRYEAVRIKGATECFVPYPAPGHYDDALCHLTVGPNNLYDTDTTGDLAVGDFDGDGRDDVFLANGTAWWYSSAGLTEWQFLRASTLGIRDLRFGKFDADAKTDVVFATGTDWQYSSGGTAEPVILRVGGTPLSECVFGDFDGNGITDAVRTYMGTWMFSHDSRTIWSNVRTSTVKAADLRVGNFDRQDLNDEIFVIEGSHWSIWNYGSSALQLLPVTLTTSIDGLVVGDFDGDRRSDIAQTSGSKWRFSPDGSSAWVTLRDSSTQPQYSDITQALLGRFSADLKTDAVRYQRDLADFPPGTYDTGQQFVQWTRPTGDPFVHASADYVR